MLLFLFLGLKRFFLVSNCTFSNHPFGNWAMYSVEVKINEFSVKMHDSKIIKDFDITELAKNILA